MYYSAIHWRILVLNFYLINVKCIIWIICINFISFGPIERILEPSKMGNLFLANPVHTLIFTSILLKNSQVKLKISILSPNQSSKFSLTSNMHALFLAIIIEYTVWRLVWRILYTILFHDNCFTFRKFSHPILFGKKCPFHKAYPRPWILSPPPTSDHSTLLTLSPWILSFPLIPIFFHPTNHDLVVDSTLSNLKTLSATPVLFSLLSLYLRSLSTPPTLYFLYRNTLHPTNPNLPPISTPLICETDKTYNIIQSYILNNFNYLLVFQLKCFFFF